MARRKAGLGQRLLDHRATRWAVGTFVLGGWLRLVRWTSRVEFDPPGIFESDPPLPVIAVSWHGHSYLAACATPKGIRFAQLTSRHPDGQLAAAAAKSFGFLVIEGSGASERQRHGTGGATAFRAMLKALEDGISVSLTGDVPPTPGQKVSPGVIALARMSGRPIYAMATSSSRRRIVEKMWDRMQINLPFSRISYVVRGPLWVTDPDISDAAYAAELKGMLDEALRFAFDMADGKAGRQE